MEERDWLMLKLLHENRNITKTAQDLYISQPALTNRIKHIEQEFQVKILIRGSKGVSFTPQGEYLVTCANDMLLQHRKVKENILNIGKDIKGTLRIGTSKFIAEHKLPNLLSLFKDQHPNVDFKIISSWSNDIVNLVNKQEVHVGFHRGELNWLGPEHLLFRDKLCIACKNKIDIQQLPTIPRITHAAENTVQRLLNQWWTEKFDQPPLIAAETDHVNTCKEMVIHGLGYAILPLSLVSGIDSLHKYELTFNNGQPIDRIARMIYLEETLELNVVKAFVNFVKSLNFQDNLELIG
jgi:DNA-binding transcriptional LysR family regulator